MIKLINENIKQYIDKFIKQEQINNYIGIIVYGSYVRNMNNNLSDLDLMIIKDNYDTQDCGSCIIDGIRIEYFVESLKTIYQKIKEEIQNNDPSHLTKFATCLIYYDKEGKVKELIDFAKEAYDTKIEHTLSDNDKFAIFGINNRIEDLESLINNNSFYAVYFIILEKIRNLYAKINGIIDLPVMKIEKIYNDKEYAKNYINSNIHNIPDSEFITLYNNCLNIKNKVEMLSDLKILYNYSFKNINFSPNSFILRFKQNAPFKV